ncbi:MAG: phosphoadenosine phosphosulfate reductase family protein [Candidatus Methanoplasma sp.]|jgi:phosphoadenosine phosphosulfate reductase|nr:phosphoadenosine phosphosulfate reductase family protein [Candidatus Methanoplasma sp.]
MQRNNVAHGKEGCLWCDHCGTLILGLKCSACGSEGRGFEINSPGDVRPCMGDSVDSVLGLFREAFGTSEPLEGRMMFLNKIPGEDRTDEIVAHGDVIGVMRFDIRLNRMRLEIRQAGADLFRDVAVKNLVTIANMSGHLKGKTVPGANVSEVIGEFGREDPLIVKKALKAGPGTALVSSAEVRTSDRAIKIRDLGVPTERPLSPASGRKEFTEANSAHLKTLESNAVSDVRSFVKGKKQPVTVSFSGGKDSLAAFEIAKKAIGGPELLFIDTGLEFPETVEYVRRFASKNGLRLHVAEAGNAFWENVGTFGPPAKDFRWCCKVCKLGPISDTISKDFPQGTITVEGNRTLESFSRSGIGFVSKNPFVPNQTNLNPVRSWSAAEIWGYIWMRGLDYNPLYDRDFERIGCYLCASCLASEWRNTKRIHPDKYEKWEKHLHAYAKERNLPPEYVDLGFWRWKALPPKMRLLADELDLRMEPSKGKEMSLKMLKGASPCAAGGYSMEAVATFPMNRDFSYVDDALRTVGDTKTSTEFEISITRMRNGKAKVFGGGQISITAENKSDAEAVFARTLKALIRAEMCTQCGICAKSCPKKAIKISGGMRVDRDRCVKCGKCEKSCMLVHYYDKITSSGRATAHDSRQNASPNAIKRRI